MLLIIGGSKDYNIERLAHAAAHRRYPHQVVLTDEEPPLNIYWQPGDTCLKINYDIFEAAETSLFIRHDVFSTLDNPDIALKKKNAAWFDALRGWVDACPEIAVLNRRHELEMSKPRALIWAQESGFSTPRTWVTNNFSNFADKENYIVKPVGGGDYTRLLSEVMETEQPWFVQEKLNYPELRLFRVGKHYFAFLIKSEILDYRTTNDFVMEEVTPPQDLTRCLERLTDRMGLDYAAADFKTCPRTGELLFLEVNSMPMFSGYDDVAKGKLSDAIFLKLRSLKGGVYLSQYSAT